MAAESPSSNYVGWRLHVFLGVFTPLQVAIVACRFWARSLTKRGFETDDWLVLASLMGQFVATGIAIGAVEKGGVGYHVTYLEETQPALVEAFFKYLIAVSAWYYVTISIPKLAILVVYRRLFPQRSVFVTLCAVAGVLICTSIASLVADLAACVPFSANWAPPDVQAVKCIDKEALFIWSTFPNIVTDVIMLALPVPIVWKLHTSNRVKAALSVTFVIGGSGLAASILRFAAFSNTNSFTDATYNAVELIIWTVAEPGIYLIAACIMMYRPLLERIPAGSLGTSIRGFTGRSAKHSGRSSSNRAPESGTDGTRIALAARHADGRFHQLHDDVEEQRLVNGQPQPQPTNITITTDIEVSSVGAGQKAQQSTFESHWLPRKP
ncbi:hypothetical protein F4780DRAFT_742769 [Xylariomycetidae sp. FL0641]|nr:hypothetical protein F4780DRAFT_742769 [Xylariomycetidae sp. FL0641]